MKSKREGQKKSPEGKVRSSNIELLRIFTMLGVILLHYNNAGIGGGFSAVEPNSANYFIMYFLESVCIIAVDLFVLISGYFMCNSMKRSIFKPITLLIQVVVFRILSYVGQVVIAGDDFSVGELAMCCIPLNYFVILYAVVYLVSPYINLLLHKISAAERTRLVVILMLLFSVEPTIVDVLGEVRGVEIQGLSALGLYGSQWGYSAANFILMYIIGAYLKLNGEQFRKITAGKAAVCFAVITAADTVWSLVNNKFTIFSARSAYEYCNPLVIFGAVAVFLIFSRIDIGSIKAINALAKGSFTVFLMHTPFLKFCRIADFVNKNPAVYVLHVLCCCVAIYLICWVLYLVYDFIMKYILAFIEKHIKMYTYEIKGE